MTMKEKGRYERVSWRWKKRMYARLPSGYQYGIKLCELIGRNNELLYNDNAFLVSFLAKINENIETIDLRRVEIEQEKLLFFFAPYNSNFPSILDAIGQNCPNLCEIILSIRVPIKEEEDNIKMLDNLISFAKK